MVLLVNRIMVDEHGADLAGSFFEENSVAYSFVSQDGTIRGIIQATNLTDARTKLLSILGDDDNA